MNEHFKTTVLIPGHWKDRKEIVVALPSRKKYLFAGPILMDIRTQTAFTACLSQNWGDEDYFAEFARSFSQQFAGETPLPINSVFVIEAETGSFQQLEKLCDAISELLEIGGYGVKIANSGKLIARKAWEGLSFSSQTLFELFVSAYHTDKEILTCGMSNFGKRDIFVPLTPDDEGINFTLSYAWYVLNEKPEIKAGETFSLSRNDPVFKIFEEEDDMRGSDHPYYNPYGIWKLWPQEWLEG